MTKPLIKRSPDEDSGVRILVLAVPPAEDNRDVFEFPPLYTPG